MHHWTDIIVRYVFCVQWCVRFYHGKAKYQRIGKIFRLYFCCFMQIRLIATNVALCCKIFCRNFRAFNSLVHMSWLIFESITWNTMSFLLPHTCSNSNVCNYINDNNFAPRIKRHHSMCLFSLSLALSAPLSRDNHHTNAKEWMDFKALPSEKVMFNMAKFSNESQERTIFG